MEDIVYRILIIGGLIQFCIWIFRRGVGGGGLGGGDGDGGCGGGCGGCGG